MNANLERERGIWGKMKVNERNEQKSREKRQDFDGLGRIPILEKDTWEKECERENKISNDTF